MKPFLEYIPVIRFLACGCYLGNCKNEVVRYISFKFSLVKESYNKITDSQKLSNSSIRGSQRRVGRWVRVSGAVNASTSQKAGREYESSFQNCKSIKLHVKLEILGIISNRNDYFLQRGNEMGIQW